jgi:hypothetical protein
MPDDPHSDSFLSRWSRRKQQAREGAVPVEPTASATEGAPGQASAPPASPASPPYQPSAKANLEAAERPIDPASLPPVEALTAESSMADFLRKGVPAELQRLALRKAWALDPQIRDFIEVAENQYNWNVPGGVPGFGELPAGTDIDRLMAQATGSIWPGKPDAETPAESAPTAAGQDSPRPEVAAASAAVESRAPTERMHTAAHPPVDKPTMPPPADGAPAVEPPKPRRHGGALPV